MEPSSWKLRIPPIHWRDLHFPDLPFPSSLGGFLLGLHDDQGARARLLFGVILAVGTLALLAAVTAVGARLFRWRPPRAVRWSLAAMCLPALLSALCLADALLVEPSWLEVTRTHMMTDRIPPGSHLRIVLLSDLHVQGWTAVLRTLADRVNALEPDLDRKSVV